MHGPTMWSMEKASCYFFIGLNYARQDKFAEAICSYLKGIAADPTYRECYMGAAKAYIELQQYSLAIAILRDALKNSYRQYSWLENDISWSYEPYDLLCHAYFSTGDYFKALACGYKALTLNPTDQRLNSNVLACLDNLQDQDF